MPAKEDQAASVAGMVVKEAVERGMETQFRDQIVEGVESANGETGARARRVPIAGALVGVGAVVGYLLGRGDLDRSDFEELDAGAIVDEMTDGDESTDEAAADEGSEADEAESTGGRSRLLPVIVLGAVAVAALEFVRRKRSGEDEWAPIEEFEPAAEVDIDDTEEDEATTATATASDEADEDEADDEE